MARVAPPPPKALRDIWAKVPQMVDCKGLCQSSCGPVPASPLERRLIEQRSGHALGSRGHLTCSMLLPNGRCSVYSIRPLICRIWGAAEGVPCTHGCKPERLLSIGEANQLMREVQALSPGSRPQDDVLDVLAQLTPQERTRWEMHNQGWQRKLDEIFQGQDD